MIAANDILREQDIDPLFDTVHRKIVLDLTSKKDMTRYIQEATALAERYRHPPRRLVQCAVQRGGGKNSKTSESCMFDALVVIPETADASFIVIVDEKLA